MIFKNIEFHNVEEFVPHPNGGYLMARLPETVRARLDDVAKERTSLYATGVELRFKINSGEATITLRAETAAEAQVAYIYYGSMQGGWEHSSRIVFEKDTVIHLTQSGCMDRLQQIHKEFSLPFSPEVIRILLPYCKCIFVDAQGDITPPSPEDLPLKTYLAYGSSITHGSLSLAAPFSYPKQIAAKLGVDCRNLGFAGSAHLEPAVAEYIRQDKSWDFASVEMGINMVDTFSPEEFEARVAEFCRILSDDPRPIFCTDIFTSINDYNENKEKTEIFRSIVKKHSGSMFHTPGRELMSTIQHVSEDLVHPSAEGTAEIAANWAEIMQDKLK